MSRSIATHIAHTRPTGRSPTKHDRLALLFSIRHVGTSLDTHNHNINNNKQRQQSSKSQTHARTGAQFNQWKHLAVPNPRASPCLMTDLDLHHDLGLATNGLGLDLGRLVLAGSGDVVIARMRLARVGADLHGARAGQALGRLDVSMRPPGPRRAPVAPGGFGSGWDGVDEMNGYIKSCLSRYHSTLALTTA